MTDNSQQQPLLNRQLKQQIYTGESNSEAPKSRRSDFFQIKPRKIFNSALNHYDSQAFNPAFNCKEEITEHFNYGFNHYSMSVYSLITKKLLQASEYNNETEKYDYNNDLTKLKDDVPIDFGGFCPALDESIFNTIAFNGKNMADFLLKELYKLGQSKVELPLIQLIQNMTRPQCSSDPFAFGQLLTQVQTNLEKQIEKSIETLFIKRNKKPEPVDQIKQETLINQDKEKGDSSPPIIKEEDKQLQAYLAMIQHLDSKNTQQKQQNEEQIRQKQDLKRSRRQSFGYQDQHCSKMFVDNNYEAVRKAKQEEPSFEVYKQENPNNSTNDSSSKREKDKRRRRQKERKEKKINFRKADNPKHKSKKEKRRRKNKQKKIAKRSRKRRDRLRDRSQAESKSSLESRSEVSSQSESND